MKSPVIKITLVFLVLAAAGAIGYVSYILYKSTIQEGTSNDRNLGSIEIPKSQEEKELFSSNWSKFINSTVGYAFTETNNYIDGEGARYLPTASIAIASGETIYARDLNYYLFQNYYEEYSSIDGPSKETLMISISSLIGQSLFLQDLLNQGLLDNYDFVITVDDNGSLVENDGLSFEEELSTIYNNYEKKYFDRNATIESLYETYTNDFLAYREVEVLVLFHSFTSGDSEELAAQRQAAIDIFSDAKTTALQENVTLGEMYSRLLNDPGVFEIDSSFDTKNGYIPNQVIYRNDQFLTDPDVINDIIWNLNEGEISDPFVGYDPIEEGDEVSATSNRFDESFVSIVRIITKKDGIDVNDEFDFFYEYGLKGVNDGGSKYLYSLTNE